MLDPTFVRENREIVEQKTKITRDEDRLSTSSLSVDEQRRTAIREAEELKRVSNVVSKEIGEAVRRGEDVSTRKEEMRVQKERIKELDDLIRNAQEKMETFLLNIPNLPNDSVPLGASAADNVPVREHKGNDRGRF